MRIILMRLRAGYAVPLLLVMTLAGCAAFSDAAPDTSGKIQVAAGFYPLAYAAERVGGRWVTVENLTTPGGEPHDLTLDPVRVAEVARARLVVYETGLQAAVEDAVGTNATGLKLDAAAVIDLRIDRDGHTDPHFWHDPLLMARLGDAIADKLIQTDPGHADAYRAGAAGLRADLEALDAKFTAGLAHCARDTVVVSHDAFGYLARYGLRFEPIAGLAPGAEPSPADLARLQTLIRDDGITTVFYESLLGPGVAEQLARDTGARAAVLDPIEGLTDQTAGEDYLSLMRANLAALEEANQCRTR
jgi:zinc transport system substrate-binding protein